MVTAVRGVMCALVTPMDETGRLDLGGLERLVDRVVRGGATGICPVGSTGEGSRLGRAERHRVVERVRSLVPAGYPVIPAPSTAEPARTVEDVEALAALGADAVLIAPPAAYQLGADDVRAFYADVAERSPLPLILYNFPQLTGVALPARVVGELAQHERIVGLKDSSRNFEYTESVLYESAAAADFAVLTGADTMLLATMIVGGAGAITASANCVPELGTAVYEAALAADWPRARTLQRRLFEVVEAARAAGFPYGWKAALELLGVCSAHPAPPATPVRGERLEALRKRLVELEVI